MGRQGTQLTRQESEFVKLVALEGKSYAAAFREAYPPKQPGRSAEAERVGGKKIARRPLVRERMEEIRSELEASDPAELRRRATGTLARILAGQSDPGLRLAAITTLRYLDAREQAEARNDREALRTIHDQMAVLDAWEAPGSKRPRSSAAKPQAEQRSPADVGRLVDEIAALVAEQRAGRAIEPPPAPVRELSSDDPEQAAEDAIPVQSNPRGDQTPPEVLGSPPDEPQQAGPEWTAEAKPVPPAPSGFRLVRKPGHFGRGGWVRVPEAR
jgi:hypothetical protein